MLGAKIQRMLFTLLSTIIIVVLLMSNVPVYAAEQEENDENTAVETTEEAITLDIVNFTLSKAAPLAVGTPIIMRAKGAGGCGSYRYKFYVLDKQSGISVFYQNFSVDNVAKWTPKKAGNYAIYVLIQDCVSGNVISSVKEFQIVERIAVKSFKITKLKNRKVKFIVKATGYGTLQYKIVVKRTKGKKITIKKYGKSKTKIYTFGKKGKYSIYLYIKDANGTEKILKKSMVLR